MPHFIVRHDIKQSDVWKSTFTDKQKMDGIMKTVSESKFNGEAGYGLDVTDKQFCLWQCDDEASIKDFPDFFHKTWHPQTVADSSKYWILSDQAMGTPTPVGHQFEQKGGTFAFVHHLVKDATKMQDQLKEWMSKGQEAGAKHNLDNGFWNHQYLPTAGESATKEFFCLWELKEGKTKEDLKTYLDTYLLKPDSTDNVVYLMNGAGGACINVPTSKFAA